MEEIKKLKKIVIKQKSEKEAETFVRDLMKKMTLKEKIGQMYQAGHNSTPTTGPEFDSSDTVKNIKEGFVGSVIGINDPYMIYTLQKASVESSPNSIPLLFCNDIIHGCNTAFPINLAMSCTFSPNLIEKASYYSAYESSHSGINLTFSPMLDLVRDPRWGRVMESNGEDPYLSSVLAKSYIKGYEGNKVSESSVLSCAKHFLGYGAAVAGREYNSVDLSDRSIKNFYLPPFKAAIDASCSMVMTSFNALNDVPMTANKYYLRNVLRDTLGFKGVTISDFTSSTELIEHRVAKNEKDVAKVCLKAGLDHEMISRSYVDYLEELVEDKEVNQELIDEACFRVLRLKYLYGLFDDPYRNIYFNYKDYLLTDEIKKASLDVALESSVLLKNQNDILPLSKEDGTLFFGTKFFENNLLGSWRGKASEKDCLSIKEYASKNNYPNIYVNSEDYKNLSLDNISRVVLAVGEDSEDSGEAKSRTCISLSKKDKEKILHFKGKNVNIIIVIFSGRPLILTDIINDVDAALYVWQLGTMASEAIIKTLYGDSNPSGKLTMTLPRNVGQIPIYYNSLPTGRPYSKEVDYDFYRSKYLDSSNEPLFKFGYGLSYSKFVYSDIKVSKHVLKDNESVTVSVKVKNDSKFSGKEVVELYIRAKSFSVSRPNYELKKFKKVLIDAYETRDVSFELTKNDFAYYNIDLEFTSEFGEYTIFVGSNLDSLSSVDIIIK